MYRKGARAERQLMEKLNRLGLGALRVAGSAGPDVVSSIGGRIVFFECKFTTKEKVYVPKSEVERELKVAEKMKATLYLAVKFNREPWHIIEAGRLPEFSTEKSYVIGRADLARLPKLTTILDKNLKDYDK